MKILRSVTTITILVSLSLLLLPSLSLAQEPPPRPAPANNAKDSHRDNGDDDAPILGDILGQVIDELTGAPGAGVIVMINDIPIRTDTAGSFSLTGIHDGVYQVDLSLPAEWVSAQGSQEIIINNRNKAYVELKYYSKMPENLSNDLRQSVGTTNEGDAALTETPPAALPQTGAAAGKYPISSVLFVAGLVMVVGGLLYSEKRLFDRPNRFVDDGRLIPFDRNE